jgi:hypothetical protein
MHAATENRREFANVNVNCYSVLPGLSLGTKIACFAVELTSTRTPLYPIFLQEFNLVTDKGPDYTRRAK